MVEEPSDFITQRIKNVVYNSINFDLALTREEGLWKILVARIIFDIVKPQGQQTLLKKDNFVIEHFSLSLDVFKHFFEYLKQVDVSAPMTVQKIKDLSTEQFFEIGIYKLNFKGNFPSKEVNFFGRQRAKDPRGIDRPIYYI